ncbi:hypothetical protein D3874_21960 [Oleomonas cavernae]|uniref:Uncharacterized protein n=1 Tax=Oleomonas cavernae TaxID=2320859 RepID=A0A418WGY9_9PROT|nr:hypothetical protein D3874_21960 [Oleomonas cavernae]
MPKGLGGIIPTDWHIDGLTEVRLTSLAAGLADRLFRMKSIFHDEFNVFDRVLPNNSRPGGGRWWTGPYQPEIGFRAIVLIRARYELRGAPFRRFVDGVMAPALLAAGAQELRTHVFQPGGRFTQWTPDVLHDQPANRTYAGALIIGTKDRAAFDKLLGSASVQSTLPAQLRHCVAMHAYAVENTYPVILGGQRQPVTWN